MKKLIYGSRIGEKRISKGVVGFVGDQFRMSAGRRTQVRLLTRPPKRGEPDGEARVRYTRCTRFDSLVAHLVALA